MAVVTLLPEALRGSIVVPDFSVPAGESRGIRLAMTSSVYGTDPTLTIDLFVDQSFDGGFNWGPWFGSQSRGGSAGQVTKGGAISDGLFVQGVQFDGIARLIRTNITVATPFVWGLTAEVLAT